MDSKPRTVNRDRAIGGGRHPLRLPALLALALCLTGCGGGGGGGGLAAASDTTPVFTAEPDHALYLDVRAAIDKIQARSLNDRDNTPWVVMHAVIAFGLGVTVERVADHQNFNAVPYLCTEARYQNQRIFRTVDGEPALPTRNVSFGLTDSYIVQDHVDQYLFAFSCAGVPTTQPILADDGAAYTVADMIQAAKRHFRPTQDLCKTIPALTYYNGVHGSFTNDLGTTYTIADLLAIASQRNSNLETEAGTHHLNAIAYALKMHAQAGGALDGSWAAARTYLDQHVALARQSQQADGSFSMAVFGGWIEPQTPKTMLWGTGHMLEWLTTALTAEQLREGWITAGYSFLTREIRSQDLSSFSDGGMYHAANALQFYRKAVFPLEP